jgi:hypothetical protein
MMNESEALLIVERGPLAATQFPLQSDQLTIGRSSGNDLVLPDPEISRRHVRIIRRVDGFAVEDTGSTNGTFVNGQRIGHLTLLQDGDAIDLGDTVRLRFMSMASPATGAAPVDLAEKPTQLYAPVAPPVMGSASPRPPAPAPAPPVYAPVPPREPAYNYPPPPVYDTQKPRRGRGLLAGCGLLLALLLVCAGTFLVLDAYDQGRLLYCGPLSSFFELVLGPFGFAPICP